MDHDLDRRSAGFTDKSYVRVGDDQTVATKVKDTRELDGRWTQTAALGVRAQRPQGEPSYQSIPTSFPAQANRGNPYRQTLITRDVCDHAADAGNDLGVLMRIEVSRLEAERMHPTELSMYFTRDLDRRHTRPKRTTEESSAAEEAPVRPDEARDTRSERPPRDEVDVQTDTKRGRAARKLSRCLSGCSRDQEGRARDRASLVGASHGRVDLWQEAEIVRVDHDTYVRRHSIASRSAAANFGVVTRTE